MDSNKEFRKKVDNCKLVLEDFLKNSEDILVSSENCEWYIDNTIFTYLEKKRFDYMLGDVSERALLDFYQQEKIFDGKVGKFKLDVKYETHSQRRFKAWPVKEY